MGSALENCEASQQNLPQYQPPHPTLPSPGSHVVAAARPAPQSSHGYSCGQGGWNTTSLDLSSLSSEANAHSQLPQSSRFTCEVYWIPLGIDHNLPERPTQHFDWIDDTLTSADLHVEVSLPASNHSSFDEFIQAVVKHLSDHGILLPKQPVDDDASLANDSFMH
ncbi:hypothetical protein OE88DRAFT_1642525 [Heliocybe sulcata]|uniref:Uncharacterized protein n=1 Tax=Heliocybe sulcata TaxID=5364 RepID=A0A5C3NBZ9_9AGAM|nr:hypothetical protein OE88DRAFT_1642525 [Heliocybe sulcata]